MSNKSPCHCNEQLTITAKPAKSSITNMHTQSVLVVSVLPKF